MLDFFFVIPSTSCAFFFPTKALLMLEWQVLDLHPFAFLKK